MGSDLGRIQRWRAEMAAGTSVGPRIVAAGYPLAGPGNTWPRSALVGVASAEEARRSSWPATGAASRAWTWPTGPWPTS
jgi:hypothetical protein